MNLIKKDFNKNFYFYKLPKLLFKNPYNKLSSNAKLCYILLLDRLNLSKSNNIIDDNGNIYIYYTRENIQKNLGISKATAIKVFNELVQAKLIKQVKDKHSYRIYIYDIFNDDYIVQNLNEKSIKSKPTIVQNLYPNKNIYNNINKSKNNFKNYNKREYPNDEEFWNKFYYNL